MSLLASIPVAAIETILGQLVLFYLPGADGDPQAARRAALAGLLAYQPQTEPELAMAADIIGYRFHIRQSLHDAADPDRPTNEVLRHLSAATSLGREAYRSLVKLEKLRKARQDDAEPEAEQAQPEVEQAQPAPPAPDSPIAEPVASQRPADASNGRYAHLSKKAIRRLSPAQQKRIYLERMTENARRRQSEQATLAAEQATG